MDRDAGYHARMRIGLVVGLLALGMTACGAEKGGGEPAAATPKATQTAAPAATAAPGAEAEIQRAAKQYIDGLADHDFKTACKAWAPSERKDLARTAGSCEQAFEMLVETTPAMAKVFKQAEAGEVRIEGEKAGVDVVQPGQTEPATTFGAILEDGHWFLADIPDAEIP
jgi:hypothetical protein